MAEEKEKALKCLRQLRSLLMDDEDLKAPIVDEKFLIRFVRAKKYDAELAYKTISKYYMMRKKNSKISKCLFPSCDPVKYVLKNLVMGKLKYNDRNGRPLIVFQNGLWDNEKQSLDELFAAVMILLDDLLMYSLDAQLNGVVVLFDMENFSIAQAKEYTLSRISALVNIYQNSYPLRLKGIYVVNQPSIIDMILVPIRPFLNEKIKQRLLLIGQDMDILHEKLPREILPQKYGGMLDDDKAWDTDIVENVMNRDSYYKELMGYGYGKTNSDEEDTYYVKKGFIPCTMNFMYLLIF